MRRILVVLLLLFASPALAAEIVWLGGGLEISNQTKPLSSFDMFTHLGDVEGITAFSETALTLRGADPGVSLGCGGRMPVMNDEALAGASIFYDYDGVESHQRIGLGGEFFHRDFSLHANVYLPLTRRKGGQEALPGLDVSAMVPIPGYEYLVVRPGLYYYQGQDESSLQGVDLALLFMPLEIMDITLGMRSDALDGGRDDTQVYLKVNVAVPMRKLGRDLLAVNLQSTPWNPFEQMANRVQRERAITFERKSTYWDRYK